MIRCTYDRHQLLAGLFMGWSLGTNDAANAFGTAVATRVVSYRTAVIIIGFLVVVGTFTGGANNINKVAELATSKQVIAATDYVAAFAQTGVAANLLTDARLRATIGGIAIAVGVLTFSKRVMMTVGSSIAEITQIDGFQVIMGNWMGIPVSTSQAVVGAVMGAGLTRGLKAVRFGVFKNIAIAWVSSPTVAGLLAVAFCTKSYFGV